MNHKRELRNGRVLLQLIFSITNILKLSKEKLNDAKLMKRIRIIISLVFKLQVYYLEQIFSIDKVIDSIKT